MKRTLHFLLLIILLSATISKALSQQVYFREGFSNGSDFATTPAASVPGQYRALSTGTWYSYGVYISPGPTGSCNTETGDLYHIRLANLNAVTTTNDSAYLITPIVNFGVSKISFYNGRAARRFSIFKTTDTLATTTNWTFVTLVPLDNTACQFTEVAVNDVTAKRIKLVARGGTDSDIDSVVLTSVNAILPVKFTAINAIETSGKIKLTWNTATEANISRYVIERSSNGTSFTEVATLYATQSSAYTWMDNAPLGGNNLYRIKAVDKDGSLLYTNIVKIAMGKKIAELTIAPNPVRGHLLNIQLDSYTGGDYNVTLINNQGQQVYRALINHTGGSSTQSLQLPSTVKSGMYMLRVINGADIINKNVVIE